MISLTQTLLELPHCQQAACRFDREQYADAQFAKLGLVLPDALRDAVSKRKAEFLAGRYCARQALAELDPAASKVPEIARRENRAPCWPAGIVGSITHSKGYAAAAVAWQQDVYALGIDSEATIKERTANNVASHILTGEEVYEENRALFRSANHYLTLVFSAKESIFKALHPHVQRYFDFRDAVIELDADRAGRFRFRLLKDLNEEFTEGFEAEGSYALDGDFVHTAVLLPAAKSSND